MSRNPKSGGKHYSNPRKFLELVAQIDTLKESEMLILLNHLTDRLKQHHQQLTRQAMNQFRPGDLVQFRSKTGEIVNGVVTRINQKSITLHTKEGVRWNVSPQLLKIVSQPDQEKRTSSKIIH